MKGKTILIFIVILTLISCDVNNNLKENSKDNFTANELNHPEPNDSLSILDYELSYVVSVASGYNYDSLKEIALQVSDHLKYEFDTLGRYYNKKKKKIVLPNDSEDEVYAGEYFLRRDNGQYISLEMQAAYIDTSIENNEIERAKFYDDSLKMFVFANLYTDKNDAMTLYNKLKNKFNETKIITTNIYIGCMH